MSIAKSMPTMAQPGSEEKVLVLIGRYERAEPLWHPNDYTNRTNMHELTGGRLRNGGLGGPTETNPHNAMEAREPIVETDFDDDDIMDDFGGEA